MHAGNLLLTADGEVVLLDWGIVGRLPDASRRFFRRSLEGALGDDSAWPDVCDHMLRHVRRRHARARSGITHEQFQQMIKAQTLLIMTMPFDELNLMMLMPTATLPGAEVTMAPTLAAGAVALAASRAQADPGGGRRCADVPQPRGELLLIKQLVFFERYGKLFLGNQPLIYDPEVYQALLALPVFEPPAA